MGFYRFRWFADMSKTVNFYCRLCLSATVDLSNITRTMDTREREKSRSNLRDPDTNENKPTADETIPNGTRSEDVNQNRKRDQIPNQKREYKNMAPVELGLDLEKIVEG